MAEKSMLLYTIRKLSVPWSQKLSHFLLHLEWRDAMDHNKFGTCLFVWAVTSKQTKLSILKLDELNVHLQILCSESFV